MINPTTRRHPRTLQEAFGPYTSRSVMSEHRQLDFADKVVVAGSLMALLALFLLAIFGGL